MVGLHIPKCAGISILEHVKNFLPREQIFQNTSIKDNFLADCPEFRYLAFPQNLRFVWGHHIHDEMLKQLARPLILFTGLRHPIARINSELNFLAHLRHFQGLAFDPNAELARSRNPICYFLINRFPFLAGKTGPLAQRAMNVLLGFNWVYFAENFDHSTAAIFHAMGIAPPTERRNTAERKVAYDVDPQYFEQDIALYHLAQAHFAGRDVAQSLRETPAALQTMLDQPIDHERMRRMLHEASRHEYATWGVIDQVIAHRRKMIEEAELEIAFYEAAKMQPATA